MADKIITPEFRVSFPMVFSPKKGEYEDSKTAFERYELTMLFDAGADLSTLKAAAKAAAVEKWGDNMPKKLRTPFLDAGEMDYDGYEEGMTFVRLSSNQKPGVVDKNVQPILDKSEFYAGCYARASVTATAYESKDPKTGAVQNRGVKFYLGNVQKVRDGEPFGKGHSNPEDDFGPATAAPAPTGDIADDPFA